MGRSMKERPILFNTPMVRALLDGTKMQMRRIAKPVKHPDLGNIYTPGALVLEREPQHVIERASPYGQPGDRLWVREAFRFPESLNLHSPAVCGEMATDAGYNYPWAPTQFEADGKKSGEWIGFETPPKVTTAGKLRPGIHMPRWASRTTLEITGVRVERLQDISEADAIAEGCTPNHNGYYWGGPHQVSGRKQMATAVRAYRDLWESINGHGSWDANPWVWVVKFRRVEGGAA